MSPLASNYNLFHTSEYLYRVFANLQGCGIPLMFEVNYL